MAAKAKAAKRKTTAKAVRWKLEGDTWHSRVGYVFGGWAEGGFIFSTKDVHPDVSGEYELLSAAKAACERWHGIVEKESVWDRIVEREARKEGET